MSNLMIRLADTLNYELLIDEFAEYSNDIDVDFSKKALEGIWKIGLKVSTALER
jgi:hypothetical protein